MQPEHEVVRLAAGYLEIWQVFFPDQLRRAEWHIVRYLCTEGRGGASVGEVSGLVRQIFLLDDATVRERINSLAKLGLCQLEASGGNITSRSFIAPSELLLQRFDDSLAAFAGRFAASVAAIEGKPTVMALPPMDSARRAILLRVIDSYCEPWRSAIDRVLAAGSLSQARRQEAKRLLISPSHWTLVLLAMRHHYEASGAGAANGLLADRMAARLLEVTGQNFQTTRDHLTYLMNLGLLERRSGKALHVALAPLAAQTLHMALGETARLWLPLHHQMLGGSSADGGPTAAQPLAEIAVDATLRLAPGQFSTAIATGPRLRIIKPATERRHIRIGSIPLTIGRGAAADLVLDAAEISRVHCRVEMLSGEVRVTDLNSTNGLYVNGQKVIGSAALRPGDQLEIGAYVLEYEQHLIDTPNSGSAGPPRSSGYKTGNSL